MQMIDQAIHPIPPIPPAAVREMRAGDLPAVSRVQAEAYGAGFLEPDAVLGERLRVAPRTAWVAEAGGRVLAYLVGYRSRLGCITPLHAVFEPVAEGPCLYLHDLAVAPAAAGRGVGPALVAHALEQARAQGCTHSALVSVQGSQAFWRRRGYVPHGGLEPRARQALASYGDPQAVYMALGLAAG